LVKKKVLVTREVLEDPSTSYFFTYPKYMARNWKSICSWRCVSQASQVH
jgi:hypothetical protein